MCSQTFHLSSTSRLRSRAGPLAPDLDGFADWLATAGYVPSSVKLKLGTVCHLGAWLLPEAVSVEALDEQRMDAFLQTRRPRHGFRRGESTTVRQLLDYLREYGRIPAAAPEPDCDGPIDRVARTYERFLVHERGLSRATVISYLPIARAFLSERFGTRPVALERLTARDANHFVLGQAKRLSRTRCKLVATALRSFLRHLHQRGDLPADLASAVLPVVHWRLSGLPKALAPEQVEALLESCNRDTSVGRRDRAILLLLARLGLRAGEVARLALDDFDWNEGTVTVSGKGQRREPLPLPSEVGEAVAAYLRDDRPQSPARAVFLRARAPQEGLRSCQAVGDVVRRALRRAGLDLPFRGSHLLRHSLATGMLRNGATLEDIGQILRHRRPDTTRIYAKVAIEALRTVASAWPGGTA